MHTRSKGNTNLQELTTHRRQRTRIQETFDQQQAMGDNVIPPPVTNPVGGGDTANANIANNGITPPGIDANNMEIRIGLINMVQANRFHGLPTEDPLDHLIQFNKLLDLIKINGVSEDALKLRMFPFSLADKAHTWEINLPPGSITTWDACKKSFLAKFFSPVRTAKLRNDISSFKQHHNESFNEAWERFRSLTHQCPHHGFSKAQLLSTIYRGALSKFRQMLDTASNGSFLGKDVDEAMELVENLSQTDAHYGDDYDRSTPSTSKDIKRDMELKALHEKMDKQATLIDKLLNSPIESPQVINSVSEFNYVEDNNTNQEGMSEEELFYMNNQSYTYKAPHPNLSYANNNVANPQDVVVPQKQAQPTQVGFANQGNQQRPQGNFPSNQVGSNQRMNQGPPGFQQQRFGNQQRFFNPQRFVPNQQGFGNTQGQGLMNQASQGYNQQQGTNQVSQGFNSQPLQGYPIQVQQGYQQPFNQLQAQPQGDLVSMMQNMLSNQSDLKTRLGSMEDEIKHLKGQSASTSHGQLPGKAETNPKGQMMAMKSQCGKPKLNEDIETKKGG